MVAALVEGRSEQPENDVILSTREAARLCRVTEERMRALALDRRVSATFAHHLWSFSRNDLERMLCECPEVLYGRKTPAVKEVTQARRERSRATMRRINAMRSREERRQAAQRGYEGLLARFGREADPDDSMDPEERAQRVRWLYEAHMADARAKRAEGQKMRTLEQKVALLTRRRAINEAAASAKTAPSVCYHCWRDYFGGRPLSQLTNVLCEKHQRENDEFAASLRDSGEEE